MTSKAPGPTFDILAENQHVNYGRGKTLPRGVWRWYHALLMLIGTFVALFGSLFAVLYFAAEDAPTDTLRVVQGFAAFAVMTLVVGCLAIAARVDLRDIGWRASHPMWVTQALAMVVPLLVLRMMILYTVVPFIVPLLPDTPVQDEPVVEQVQEMAMSPTQEMVVALATIVLIAVGAGVVEEVLFRGVLHHWLRNHMGFWGAALISGLIFGAVHMNIPQFVTATVLGIVASWLYEQSGSLLPPMVLHTANNFIAQGLSYVGIALGGHILF
jgi:membrane protease YdiL (CAAX protease family)